MVNLRAKVMKKGFTLAEILIVFTIIGVVAALTIPYLYANYQKQQYVTQLKTVYTGISQAIKLFMANEGISKISASNILTAPDQDSYEVTTQRAGNDFLKKYFKIVTDCGTEEHNLCFPAELSSFYCVIIASGASVCIQPGTEERAGMFVVDINGLKPPNTSGRDIFNFSFYYDGSLDESVTPECKKGKATQSSLLCLGAESAQALRENRSSKCWDSEANFYGSGCFGKILNDGWKMDY